MAVTIFLVLSVFAILLSVGIVWTLEMQQLLTETDAVDRILIAFMGGIILLVSIVVSINSIAISYDITSIETQQARLDTKISYRREIGALTEEDRLPSDPTSFLYGLTKVIRNCSQELLTDIDTTNQDFRSDVEQFVDTIESDIEELAEMEAANKGMFGALWMGLEFNYGKHIDESQRLKNTYGSEMSDSCNQRLEELVNTFKLFAVGREYFKTLYYNQEVSHLSRMLLIVSLPAIIITASAILAINANLLPAWRLFGIPPLQMFVAAVVTISLFPYIVLTSYMLRLTAVALQTVSGGPFWLK